MADIARAAGHEVAAYAENEDRARCSERMEELPILPVLAFLLFLALVTGLFLAWRRRRSAGFAS